MQIISSGVACGVAVASYSSPLLAFQKNANGPEYSPKPAAENFTLTYETAWIEAFKATDQAISKKGSTHAEQAPAKRHQSYEA
jgi:hypothetical protein